MITEKHILICHWLQESLGEISGPCYAQSLVNNSGVGNGLYLKLSSVKVLQNFAEPWVR